MTNLPIAKKRKNLLWCIDISHFGACMRLAFRRHVNEYENSVAETGYFSVCIFHVLRKITFDFKSILGYLSLNIMSSSRLTIFKVRFLTVRI